MTAALITGASTGIGRELARLFAADGVDVVVVSSERSVAELTALAEELRSDHGVRVHTITGFFASPVHGGNHDKVGWQLVGWSDALEHEAPFGYYDAQPRARG